MLRHYLVLSLKVLRRRAFFTAISLFGISFTLLALVVVTALLDHTLGPLPPETRLDRTLISTRARFFGPGNSGCCGASFSFYDRHARHLPGVQELSIFSSPILVHSYLDGRKLSSQLKRTDAAFWNILEFTFLDGRPYTQDEVDRAASVAVINEATARQSFGDAPAVGRTFEADGQRYWVVGVVENVSELRRTPFADVWVPHTTARSVAHEPGLRGNFSAIALAADPSAMPAIREEFEARLVRIDRAEFPPGYDTVVAPFETAFDSFARLEIGSVAVRRAVGRDPSPQGWKFLAGAAGLAGLFMLLPAVNLMNLNISRIMERASEIGVRKAFGASSAALVWQFVAENVVLTTLGGLLALLLSVFVLGALNESGFLAYSRLAVNVRVFGYALLFALVFGVLSGAYPAWRMSRLHPAETLRGGDRR